MGGTSGAVPEPGTSYIGYSTEVDETGRVWVVFDSVDAAADGMVWATGATWADNQQKMTVYKACST